MLVDSAVNLCCKAILSSLYIACPLSMTIRRIVHGSCSLALLSTARRYSRRDGGKIWCRSISEVTLMKQEKDHFSSRLSWRLIRDRLDDLQQLLYFMKRMLVWEWRPSTSYKYQFI